MATFRTSSSVTATQRSSNRLSLASLASFATSVSSESSEHAVPSHITVTTTVTAIPTGYPAPVPPPFAPSLGSDERLPLPRRGAPPVAPPQSERAHERSILRTLRRKAGLEKQHLDPALCEGWN
ncbi:hypothetical protein B0H10DRAFT_2194557 [Mycena sp. CBHHK59/15]|nr:hypothetical protein B0H10DRAFT_2194557 [Mycena sp. CBHHK59/15]